MGKAALILGVLAFILLITTSLFFSQAATARDRADTALELADTTRSLLRAYDITCRARPDDYIGIAECIKPALIKNSFSVQSLENFDERRNETGALIIVNDGKKTYEGENFVLKKNGEIIVEGCHITGEILPEYTCRFPIEAGCDEGDIFEVTYVNTEKDDEFRVVTEVC